MVEKFRQKFGFEMDDLRTITFYRSFNPLFIIP